MILKGRAGTDLPSNGHYLMKNWLPGIVMLNILPASAEILTDLDTLPDGDFLPAWEMNCVETDISGKINAHYKDRHVVQGRCAHLTKPRDIHIQQGRNPCQARSECERGCPFGGYFSSNSTTLPWALKTGNLTIQTRQCCAFHYL